MNRFSRFLILALLPFSCFAQSNGAIKVAAIQCYTHMGCVESNRALLLALVSEAASNGAKIIVMPECAVTGYMNPARDDVWSCVATNPLYVGKFAEPVPGPSTHEFSRIASNRAVYLIVSLVEDSDGHFYNAQILLNHRGEIVAHHRKKNLWPPGDGTWATAGELPVQVVDSEYGRLGLMICYDVHVLATELAKLHADIVLYSIGWYGPNTENWFRNIFPDRFARANHFAVIGANWTVDNLREKWPGQGWSFACDREGHLLDIADDAPKPKIVYAMLSLAVREQK